MKEEVPEIEGHLGVLDGKVGIQGENRIEVRCGR